MTQLRLQAVYTLTNNQCQANSRQGVRAILTKYSIGYYPTNSKKDGTFRAVKVQVSAGNRRIVARTRNGYTAPREGEPHSSVNK